MNDQPVQEPPATDTPPRFQFSLLQLLVAVVAAGVYLGVSMFAPVTLIATAPIVFIILIMWLFQLRVIKVLELLGIFLLVLIIIGFTLPRIGSGSPRRMNAARLYLSTIAMALEKYRDDFRAYPPDNTFADSGSEVLCHYLCRRTRLGVTHFGPYIENVNLTDTDGDGKQELMTPSGFYYLYILRTDKSGVITPQVIDPGPDGLFGGKVIPGRGFVPDNTDANADGIPDDQDNLSSQN